MQMKVLYIAVQTDGTVEDVSSVLRKLAVEFSNIVLNEDEELYGCVDERNYHTLLQRVDSEVEVDIFNAEIP